MTVTLAAESPLSEDVRRLIAELNATLLALTPAEYCSHMTVEQMSGPETTVFVARTDGTGSVKRFMIRACAVLPVNGAEPVSISYNTQPRLYTSLRPSGSFSPDACSGLM